MLGVATYGMHIDPRMNAQGEIHVATPFDDAVYNDGWAGVYPLVGIYVFHMISRFSHARTFQTTKHYMFCEKFI